MRPLYDLASVFADQIRVAESESALMLEPVIALVTDNKDPQKLGRVKVKYPTLSKQDTSFWAPIIMPGAGRNRGWFFIPEVEDEVLVMFENGDMNKPLVVGALWNGKDKPPDNNQGGGNDRRVIRSREGNKITFDDTKGAEKIIIEDGKGYSKITIDSVANLIKIEAMQGDVCFQAPQGAIEIVAKSGNLEGTVGVDIHSGAPMNLGSSQGTTIKGTSVSVSGAMINTNCNLSMPATATEASVAAVPDKYGS